MPRSLGDGMDGGPVPAVVIWEVVGALQSTRLIRSILALDGMSHITAVNFLDMLLATQYFRGWVYKVKG